MESLLGIVERLTLNRSLSWHYTRLSPRPFSQNASTAYINAKELFTLYYKCNYKVTFSNCSDTSLSTNDSTVYMILTIKNAIRRLEPAYLDTSSTTILFEKICQVCATRLTFFAHNAKGS